MYHSYHTDLLAELTTSKLIQLAQQFVVSAVLDSNGYEDKYGKFEFLAAFGVIDFIAPKKESFLELEKFVEKHQWVFGGMSYDLKNELEQLNSLHENKIGFPELYFFAPDIIVYKERDAAKVTLLSSKELSADELIDLFAVDRSMKQALKNRTHLTPKMNRSEYIEKVEALKNHIQLGDIYEVNFCQEFYNEQAELDPYHLMIELNGQSQMPFSTFFKWNKSYLMGASPERFLCKRGNRIIAQPIKGTAKRGSTAQEDQAIKIRLKNDLKEQNENVMIVDLMRNDLSKTASRGSVEVEELFGIYTFPQVHQMISTVTAQLKTDYTAVDAIKNAFPMGSMTGAPKVRAMELIDKFECTRRGWYSGAIGYFSPDGDFDFNVIIRTLQYNAQSNYLSLIVGGAITNKAQSISEYEECLLKAKAIFNVLNHKEEDVS